MFQYLLSTIVLDFMEFPGDRCHGWKLWMSTETVFWVAIDGDLPSVVIFVVNSEFAVARRDMYP